MFLDDDGDIPNTDDGHSECYADFKEWATESPSHCLIPGVPVAILLAVAQSIRSTFLPRPRPENGRVRRVFFWSCHVCVLMMLPSCGRTREAFFWRVCVCVCVCAFCAVHSPPWICFALVPLEFMFVFSTLHTPAAVPSQAQFRPQLVGEQT